MPDQLSPNFEQTLEADIRILAAEVIKHRERPEAQKMSGEEIIKHALHSFPPTHQQAQPQQQQATAASPLPAYAQNASSEMKLEIEYLLDMAFHAGIAKADAEAKKSPPFVLDAFHDALAGKLYPEFQKRGIVK